MNDYITSELNKINTELSGIWPDWKAVRMIGRGSFGSVYEIQRYIGSHLQRTALKVIRISAESTGIDQMMLSSQKPGNTEAFYRKYIKSIQNEIILMQQFVGNSHIISYEDHAIRERTDSMGWDIYIRMELLTGLQDYLKTCRPDEKMVIKLGMDISQGLSDCHREGIVHRDVKPQNIFINKAGNFKIGDFGVSRFAPANNDTLSFKGTVSYMAPEVFHLKGTDARSDIYSLGMVLYQMLNDYRPPFLPEVFTPDDIEKVKEIRFSGEKIPNPAHGSPELKRIACKALASDPDDRFQTADEMYRALQKIHIVESADTWETVSFSDLDKHEEFFQNANAQEDGSQLPPEREAILSDLLDPAGSGNTETASEQKEEQAEPISWDIKDVPAGQRNLSAIGKERKGHKTLPFIIVAAVAVIAVILAVKLFPAGSYGDTEGGTAVIQDDFEIDWGDPVLEAKMRRVTGITEDPIRYKDVKDIKELHLSNPVNTLDSTMIKDISALKYLTNLEELYLSRNAIKDIDALRDMKKLRKLDLHVNALEDISPLTELTNLEYLYLQNNKISDISPLANAVRLKELNLNNNAVSDIGALADLQDLQLLYLNNNGINNLDVLQNLTHMQSLSVHHNDIRDISSLSGLTELRKLDLSSNTINDIFSLRELSGIETLNMADNGITNISDLKGLQNLIDLDVSSNQIRFITVLSSLPNIKRLNIAGNPITDYSPIEGRYFSYLEK